MSRLVVVSNRVWPARGEALAGGLAVAIASALHDRGGLWVGWSGKITDQPAEQAQLVHIDKDKLTLATIDFTPDEHEGYYNGYANRCLWPLCHFRIDLTAYESRFAQAYRQVNRRMARALMSLIAEDDLIWVHDYHLIMMAAELRNLGCRNRIGFFLHTPFPPPDLLMTLPDHELLMKALFEYDLIGMQTEHDVQRLRDYIERHAEGHVEGCAALVAGRRCQLGAFPVGIDTERFHSLAFSGRGEQEFNHMRDALRGRDQIISVDRLDYAKGLLRRVNSFEALLEGRPDLHGSVEYLQIAPISRSQLQPYRDFRRDLEAAAASVNGRFARIDWTPVRYLNRTLSRRRLAGLYRASKVGLVTPMRDGMNLVCKEYVAAQDPADPGVLVLSRFAGAATQMQAALIVNPYDLAEVAGAMGRALAMPIDERRQRHEQLMLGLRRANSSYWSKTFVEALASMPGGRANSDKPSKALSDHFAV